MCLVKKPKVVAAPADKEPAIITNPYLDGLPERTNQNADNQQKAAAAEANSMYSRINRPTILGAGLRIAQAGVGGYYQGKGIKLSQDAASKGPFLNG